MIHLSARSLRVFEAAAARFTSLPADRECSGLLEHDSFRGSRPSALCLFYFNQMSCAFDLVERDDAEAVTIVPNGSAAPSGAASSLERGGSE